MDAVVTTVRTAVAIFAGTNLDDLVVVTMLFLSLRASGQPRPPAIWAGQYLGTAVLVAVSVVAALGLLIVPGTWAGLLGVVPLAMGVRRLIAAIRADGGPSGASRLVPVARASPGVLSVAAVTVGNGGDNLSIYIPVFRAIGPSATALTVAVFAVGVALWCLAGSVLCAHKRIIEVVERHGQWIVPAVYIVIGAVIVVRSGVIGHIG